MKLIKETNDLFYITIPCNLYNEDKELIIKKVKLLFLNYNKKYDLLEPGFYEVSIYFNDLLGTILKIEKIDTFEFSSEIDLKIIIKDKIKISLEPIDYLEFPNYKKVIDTDTLSKKEFLSLIEHTKIVIENKKVLH